MPLRTLLVTAAALSLLFVPPATRAQEPPKFILEWGGTPGTPDGLAAPNGLVAGSNAIVVVDGSGRLVTRFTHEGGMISGWNAPTGSNSTRDLQSGYYGIALAPGGRTLLTAEMSDRVELYSGEGTLVRSWSGGDDEGDLKRPRGVAVSATGFTYIADSGNHRILKYKDENTLVAQWGSFGSGAGQFDTPSGIAVSVFGHVFVTDEGNNRVQRFTEDGAFVMQWGSTGSADGQFLSPTGITTDDLGNVYVVDTHNNRVQKFSAEGFYLYKFAADGDGESIAPMGIAVDAGGSIYVSDRSRNRVLKFGYPIPVDNATWSGIKALGAGRP